MEFSPEELDNFRRKLLYKIRFHVGSVCPDVDDLAQETLARFVRSANQELIRTKENIGAFLNGVCNNVVREYRRRLWREIPYDADVHAGAPVVSEAEIMETRDSIEAALGQLSSRDQRILREFFLEERSKEDICREMSLSDPQFRVILFRAKDRFRQIFRDDLKQKCFRGH